MPDPRPVKPQSNWTYSQPERLYTRLGMDPSGGPVYTPKGIPCFFDGELGDKPNPSGKHSFRWRGNVLLRRALVADWDLGSTQEVCNFLRGVGLPEPTDDTEEYLSARERWERNHAVLPMPSAIALTRGFGTGVHAWWALPGAEDDIPLFVRMAELLVRGTGADERAGRLACSVIRRPCNVYIKEFKTYEDRHGALWVNPEPDKWNTKEELYEAVMELEQPPSADPAGTEHKSSRGSMTYTRKEVDAALDQREPRRGKKGKDPGNYRTYFKTAWGLVDAYLRLGLSKADALARLLAHSPGADEGERGDIKKLVDDFRQSSGDSDNTIGYATLFYGVASEPKPPAEKPPNKTADEPTEPATDAKTFLKKYGSDIRRGEGSERQWWIWVGSYWRFLPNNDGAYNWLVSKAEKEGWPMAKSHAHKELAAWIRGRVQPFDGMDKSAGCVVPFKDCCYNLRTEKVVPHNPLHLNTWALPWLFSNNKNCPKILAFLHDRFPDDEDYRLFLCFCWAALTGHRPKAFLELVGDSNTGKTTAANLIDVMVGSGATVSGSLGLLEGEKQPSRFETLRYRGKRVARMNECGKYKGPLDVVKAFTGGDSIRAEGKGSTAHEDFVFGGVMVMVGNSPVICRDPALAGRRRTILMNEVVEVEDQQDILVPVGGRWYGKIVDEMPQFIRYLLDLPEEIPNPRQLIEKRSTSSQQRVAKVVEETDNPVIEWMVDHCSVADDKEDKGMLVGDLYGVFKTWQERELPEEERLGPKVFAARCRSAMALALPGQGYPTRPKNHTDRKGAHVLRLHLSGEIRLDRRPFGAFWA